MATTKLTTAQIEAIIDAIGADNEAVIRKTPTQALVQVAKYLGTTGYSSLTKGELVEFLKTGSKPDAKEGSARALRKTAKDLKDQGLLSGPLSTIKVEALREAVTKAQAGKVVELKKDAPRTGTSDWHKNLLREGMDKGYSVRATTACKALFGKTMSISKLKAADLKTLCLHLKLVNGAGNTTKAAA